jgi:OmcA/MtrC family decaheme c-type cytochrome
MSVSRYVSMFRWGLLALAAAALAGCGGGGGGGSAGGGGGGGGGNVAAAIAAEAADPANDISKTETNPSIGFKVLNDNGVPAVTIHSAPMVHFTLFQNGHVVQGLTASNVSVLLAKLNPAANGDPEQWENYIYNSASGTGSNDIGPADSPRGAGKAWYASAFQATSDSGGTLEGPNADGYYTYTFGQDITDPNGPKNLFNVVYEPNKVHRLGLVVHFTDADNNDNVVANPYFDFTIDANGNSVQVTDPSKTRVMALRSNCNQCHKQLALHGSTGRIDPQICVLCHNPWTTDPQSGNVLELKTMVHKIHAGKLLASTDGGAAEDYTIWGHSNSMNSYAEVGFPQDIRNCYKCHNGTPSDNPDYGEVAPQGDNWKTVPSKQACLTCHKTDATSPWYDVHITALHLAASVDGIGNDQCAACHANSTRLGAATVHFNQNADDSQFYTFVIDSATYNSGTRNVTVQYHIDNPQAGNASYDLTDAKFSSVYLYVAYSNLADADSVTEFSSYNNGGNQVRALVNTGVNQGGNVYKVNIPIPADDATHKAKGTARVMSIGQVKELLLSVVDRTPVDGVATTNVSMVNVVKDVALTGSLNPRRTVVSDEACSKCHSILGNTGADNDASFHSGARNSVLTCTLCHDANRGGGNLKMGDGTLDIAGNQLSESYQFKRLIHGIHGGAKRTYDFFHGSTNYTQDVAFPGDVSDCTTCHGGKDPVTGVYPFENDRGPFGTLVDKNGLADPEDWLVISPKAASCSACHDSIGARTHMIFLGGATFAGIGGTAYNTQRDILQSNVGETCLGCHGADGIEGVKIGNAHSGLANPEN